MQNGFSADVYAIFDWMGQCDSFIFPQEFDAPLHQMEPNPYQAFFSKLNLFQEINSMNLKEIFAPQLISECGFLSIYEHIKSLPQREFTLAQLIVTFHAVE